MRMRVRVRVCVCVQSKGRKQGAVSINATDDTYGSTDASVKSMFSTSTTFFVVPTAAAASPRSTSMLFLVAVFSC